MEAALERIDAGLLVLDEASNQPLVAVRDADSEIGTKFTSLDRLACNLKLGQLNQVVAVNEDGVELGTRHKEGTVAVVEAKELENAVAADSLVDKLFE